MSSNSAKEKQSLEKAATELFIKAYERRFGTSISYLCHNAPMKPDVSCELNGERIDFEIAHLYGSEQEAMKILGRELTDETRLALQQLSQNGDTDSRLQKALLRILCNKAVKRYDSNNVWLVIRNAHPSWRISDALQLNNALAFPDSHPFSQIWLIRDFAGKEGILRLFPEPIR